MCGIAGFSLANGERIDSLSLARALLGQIVTRGRDATGAAWTTDGEVWYDKAAVPGPAFGARLSMNPVASTVILHTRFATQGSPSKNENNHPFICGDEDVTVGVHNGIVTNDRLIFDLLDVDRSAETDSEAIFAALAYSGMSVTDSLSLIEGDAAIAWINTKTPNTLRLARLAGRPLAISETPGGSLIFASTEYLLRTACRNAGVGLRRVFSVPEFSYLIIRGGTVKTLRSFAPVRTRATTAIPPTSPATRAAADSRPGTVYSSGKTWKSPRPEGQRPLWDLPADPRDLVPVRNLGTRDRWSYLGDNPNDEPF